MNAHRVPILLLTSCLAAASARADVLTLTQGTNLDISALHIGSCGDLAFHVNSSTLWVADGSTNGRLHLIDPVSGSLISTVDPSAIPGLDQGPDALAVGTTSIASSLFVFSTFGESEGGRLSPSGALIADYGTSHAATGADFDITGQLWVVSGSAFNGGTELRTISPSSGVVTHAVSINPAIQSRMVDVAFDPHTNACYVLTEVGDFMYEINLSTGNVVSSIDLTPFLISGGALAGGMDFDATGSRLFLYTGTGAGADTVVVLNREFGANACSNGPGEVTCPCGNVGLAGRGCNNSFNTGGGLLRTSGVPRVTGDTFALNVLGLPPTTTCLFFQGTSIPQEIFAFGDGSRCLGGSVIRLGTKSTTAGAAQYPTGVDPLVHVRGQIPIAGATRYYQGWYRNTAAFCTPDGFNLTNATKVYWAP